MSWCSNKFALLAYVCKKEVHGDKWGEHACWSPSLPIRPAFVQNNGVLPHCKNLSWLTFLYFIISLLQSVASTFFSSFYVVCGFHNFYWLHQGTAKINIAFMCRNRNIWSKWPYCTDILEEVSFYPHWRV